MIFDISPFRSDKNIGKAYNERISVLPDDSWIIIRDGDCMYLTPDYGNVIERIIHNHGEEYALIGALTNRLGNPDLLYKNEFSLNHDIKHHYEIAQKVKLLNQGGIKESNICAGFFMMFKKQTWIDVGGFEEEKGFYENQHRLADVIFSRRVLAKGLKIGIAQDLYLYHAYRVWNDNKNYKFVRQADKHLI